MAFIKDREDDVIPLEWRYSNALPGDKTILAKAWKLLESYSGIPPDEIEEHVSSIVCIKFSSERSYVLWHQLQLQAVL
jgi:hypothetical protein